MKTIYINGRFLTQRITGVQRYAREIVKAIDAKNFEWGDLRFVLLVPSNYDKSYTLKNIPIQIIDGNGNYYWEQIKVPFYLRKKKDYYFASLCNVAPLLLGTKNIVVVHDTAILDHPEFYSKKFVLTYKFIYKHELKSAKLVFTVSEFSKNKITSYYKIPFEKIIVTYSAADSHFSEHDLIFDDWFEKTDKPICFSVGSASANKNMKYVIACALKNPNYLFVISGESNKVFNYLKNPNEDLPSNVRMLGYLNDDELKSMYKHCEYFLFPSIYEGFGVPPLEASGLGCKKLIVSDIPTMREIFGDNVNYLDPLGYQNAISMKDVKSFDYANINKLFTWNNAASIMLDTLLKLK